MAHRADHQQVADERQVAARQQRRQHPFQQGAAARRTLFRRRRELLEVRSRQRDRAFDRQQPVLGLVEHDPVDELGERRGAAHAGHRLLESPPQRKLATRS